jgi:hypothetical protein
VAKLRVWGTLCTSPKLRRIYAEAIRAGYLLRWSSGPGLTKFEIEFEGSEGAITMIKHRLHSEEINNAG